MSETRIIIVDQNDNVIGAKLRSEALPTDIYRASGLWVTRGDGKILLARRAYTKKNSPGKWGPAVAGTVEEGETYLSNIIKEAKEELGLDIGQLQELTHEASLDEYNHFTQWYGWEMDDQAIVPEPAEVAEIGWFTKEEILVMVEASPDQFLKGMKTWVENFSKN